MSFQEFLYTISFIVIIFVIGRIILKYLNNEYCTHKFEEYHIITINDKDTGVYMKTIYHQKCTKCNKMRKYILTSK